MRHSFTPVSLGPGQTVRMPVIPIRLTRKGISLDADALVDSGAMIGVLPFDLGIRLGLDWNAQPQALSLGGALGGTAKVAVLDATVGPYPPVTLLCAWASSPKVRLILGQANFFLEFDVSFHASRNFFEVVPRP